MEAKLSSRQVEVMKLNMVIEGLEKRQLDQEMEIERLRRTQDLSSYVAELPFTCVEDLTSQERIKHVKQSGL